VKKEERVGVIIVIKTEIANHDHHDQQGAGREQSPHKENRHHLIMSI